MKMSADSKKKMIVVAVAVAAVSSAVCFGIYNGGSRTSRSGDVGRSFSLEDERGIERERHSMFRRHGSWYRDENGKIVKIQRKPRNERWLERFGKKK